MFEDQNKTEEISLELRDKLLKGDTGAFEAFTSLVCPQESQRVKVAKTNARINPESTSKHINLYKINNPEYLFSIAKIAYEHDPQGTLKYLSKYQVDQLQARLTGRKVSQEAPKTENIEFLPDIYQDTSESTGEFLPEKFEEQPAKPSNPPEFLPDIFAPDAPVSEPKPEKIHLEASPELLKGLLEGKTDAFDELNRLYNHSERVDIAKRNAITSGRSTLRHLSEYGITSPKDMLEIAKLANSSDSQARKFLSHCLIPETGTSIEPTLLKISGPTDTLIKQLLEGKMSGFADLYQNYQSEGQRAYIAQIVAQAGEFGLEGELAVLTHFPKYKVNNPEYVFTIAKVIAESGNNTITNNLEKIPLTREDYIANILAREINNKLMSYHQPSTYLLRRLLKGIKIDNLRYLYGEEEERFNLAKKIALIDGQVINKTIDHYKLDDSQRRLEVAKIALQTNAMNGVISESPDAWTIKDNYKLNFFQYQELRRLRNDLT